MPQKPNRYGMQEYVPEGNGDASGEYADKEGNNKGFSNFKQPEREKTAEVTSEVTPEETAPSEEPKDFTETIKARTKNNSDRSEQAYKEMQEQMSNEGRNILHKYLTENDKLNIKFGGTSSGAAGWAYGSRSIVTDHNPHTITHELGHTFDYFYAKDIQNPNEKYGLTPSLSTHYVGEDGKTFNQILHDEIAMHTSELNNRLRAYKTGRDSAETKMTAMRPILEAFNQYCSSLLDTETGIKNSYARQVDLSNEINALEREAEKKAIESDEFQAYINAKERKMKIEHDYAESQHAQGNWSVWYSDSPEARSAREEVSQAWEKYSEKRREFLENADTENKRTELKKIESAYWKVYKKTDALSGIMGDLMVYSGVGGTKFTTNGHGSHYFNERKTSGIAQEVWANMFDIATSNDEGSKATLKKMLPKSFAMMEQLVKKFGGV